MKIRNFGKFTKFNVSFWKIYHEKKTNFLNLPFYGNISMEIGIMGYGTMPRGGGRQVKIAPTFSGYGGQVA
jgi:hypothetical protein